MINMNYIYKFNIHLCIALLFLLITVCGCRDDAVDDKVTSTGPPLSRSTPSSLDSVDGRASGRKDVSVEKTQTKMLTESEAINIAKRTIKGKAIPQDGSPITAELKDSTYVVTFVHINPPGVKGADYDARILLDATTGEVKQLLLGP
jgi:hypothetical protein